MVQRVAQYWQFIMDAGPLLGDVIHYHPSLLTEEITETVKRLLGCDGVPIDELIALIERYGSESETLVDSNKGSGVIEDVFLSDILTTTKCLSIKHGWIPLSDDPMLPAPVKQDLSSSADELAASLALRMLTLSLPAPESVQAEQILEIRGAMQDELIAFRMMALKLAGDLRNLLSPQAGRRDVEREVDFLIKTKLLPHVAEIRRRVQMERGKMWRKVFGKTPKWLTLGLSCFADPTGAAIATALREASKDAASLLQDAHRTSFAGDPGVALLIHLQDQEK